MSRTHETPKEGPRFKFQPWGPMSWVSFLTWQHLRFLTSI